METPNQSSEQTKITLKVCFYIFMFGYLSFAKVYHLKEVKIITSQREKDYTAIHTCLFCRGFPCILLCSHLSKSRLYDDSHSYQRSDHILHYSHFRNILLHILLKKKQEIVDLNRCYFHRNDVKSAINGGIPSLLLYDDNGKTTFL